jgi:hypothetical protein
MRQGCSPAQCRPTSTTHTSLVTGHRNGRTLNPGAFHARLRVVVGSSTATANSREYPWDILPPCRAEVCSRHRKKHLSPSERPHMCSVPDCGRGFLYPKDLERHQARHRQLASIACSFPGCRSVFGRRDNLLRHQRKKHPDLVPAL